MSKTQILMVDDDIESMESLAELMRLKYDYTVYCVGSGSEALNLLCEEAIDVVLSDLNMEPMDGMALFKEIRKKYTQLPVLMISASSCVARAVQAMREGVFDYLCKPVNLDEVQLRVEQALKQQGLQQQVRQLQDRLDKHFSCPNIIGNSAAMEVVLSGIHQVAPTPATVLIEGETGTGKDLIANALHTHSTRNTGPFLALNCSSLSESLLESELFGHEKGAFTGALQKRAGKFEQAQGGTLFLDEVSEIPLTTQVKLLRILENREVVRVGGHKAIALDFRLVAATNRPLEQLVESNLFRRDLYHRLNVVKMNSPPLRERISDIDILIHHFLQQLCSEHGYPLKTLSQEALAILRQYTWPGNVRELKNCVESMVVMCRNSELSPAEVPQHIIDPLETKDCTSKSSERTQMNLAQLPLSQVQRMAIEQTLEAVNYNKTRAAQQLDIGRNTLLRKMQEYELTD